MNLQTKSDPLFVGITGGIGAGKSVVSGILRSMGYAVYDADAASKALCDNDEALRTRLIQAFGPSVYDGTRLNRFVFAQIIFQDETQRAKAESIIHPEVVNDLMAFARHVVSLPALFDGARYENFLLGDRCCGDRSIVFVESAILMSSPLKDVTRLNVLVKASEECRTRRALVRDSSSLEEVKRRIAVQKSESELLPYCHFVIDNNDNIELLPQIIELLRFLNKA